MKKINMIGIIPARLASTRFPGKPLAPILGIPMIGHVYNRSKMSKMLRAVYVATCDKEIAAYVSSIGGQAIMTADTHERASDRTAECMLKIEEQTGEKIDIVVMIQGDEPMIRPEMIDAAIAPLLADKTIEVVNLMSSLKTKKEQADPNEVKVVVDRQGYALYFSREPIPSWKKGAKELPMLKQVCVIPFRRDFLLEFNKLKQTPLEIAESIDMLRLLENGHKIKMVRSAHPTYSVDTQNDLKEVEKHLRKDPLLERYRGGE